MHSWRSVLLPFIEQQELYKEYDFSKPWNSPENMRLADRMPATYATNYQKGKVTTNYLAIVGPETIWRTNEDGSKALPRRSSEVSDDRDSTLLFVENFGKEVHWLSPYDLEFDEMSFELDDPMGISSYYKDPAVTSDSGDVFQLKENASPEVVRAMATADGGERISDRMGIEEIRDGRDREVKTAAERQRLRDRVNSVVQ